MKNNKGFSILELIVSFTISTVVIITLFQIILVLKELYEKSAIKTSILNKQNIIVDLIYTDILESGLSSVSSCEPIDSKCVKFNFFNGLSKELKYSAGDSVISYDSYLTNVLGGTTVENFEFSLNNEVYYVRVPITHKLFNNEKFDIRIVHYQST